MKNYQEHDNMGGSNDKPTNQQPLNQQPKRPASSRKTNYKDPQQGNIPLHTTKDNNNSNIPQSLITTTIGQYRSQFVLVNRTNQIQIKCTNKKTNKKYITSYKYDALPKIIQITYKSIQQLFQQIKYIVQENIPDRLTINEDGKLTFNLQTKKKGKSEYVPEVFQMEEENGQKAMSRLEDDVERLKMEDSRKDARIFQLQKRIAEIQTFLNIPTTSNNGPQGQQKSQRQIMQNQFRTTKSPMDTITSNQGQQLSIIKKFKKSKSNQNLNKTIEPQKSKQTIQSQDNIQPTSNPFSLSSTFLKTTVKQFDCFIELQKQKQSNPSFLKIQLLSKRQARIYRCLIVNQNIPKTVYSFVPTVQKLYDQLAFIVNKGIKNRLDIVDNNFVYRASINEKNQQVLVDGVFQTEYVQQNDLERIEELIDLKTQQLENNVKELRIELDLLKINLKSNDIILQKPQGLFESKIIQSTQEYITLCKFFKNKIYKISLLYRASQNNFQLKKFHEKCDGIPNTLTVIWTEFDKKIGGFTSEQWDRNGAGKSVSDYQSHSFIFSLSNKHKFALQQHQHAIQTGAQDGPRFGNGADLVIKDKSNQNTNSYANICTSYTHPRYTYKNLESYKYFSGDDKTNRFATKEWQVFEVFFQE